MNTFVVRATLQQRHNYVSVRVFCYFHMVFELLSEEENKPAFEQFWPRDICECWTWKLKRGRLFILKSCHHMPPIQLCILFKEGPHATLRKTAIDDLKDLKHALEKAWTPSEISQSHLGDSSNQAGRADQSTDGCVCVCEYCTPKSIQISDWIIIFIPVSPLQWWRKPDFSETQVHPPLLRHPDITWNHHMLSFQSLWCQV